MDVYFIYDIYPCLGPAPPKQNKTKPNPSMLGASADLFEIHFINCLLRVCHVLHPIVEFKNFVSEFMPGAFPDA